MRKCQASVFSPLKKEIRAVRKKLEETESQLEKSITVIRKLLKQIDEREAGLRVLLVSAKLILLAAIVVLLFAIWLTIL